MINSCSSIRKHNRFVTFHRSYWQFARKNLSLRLCRLAMAIQNSPIDVRYYFIVFCFFLAIGFTIFSCKTTRDFDAIPLFSPAVSSFARRFIILFLYRDKFFAVERNAQDVAQLKYTKIVCKVMIVKVREKNVSQRQNK